MSRMNRDDIRRAMQSLADAIDLHLGWTETAKVLPPEGVEVNTKIDDGLGVRNVQALVRQGRLFYRPDMLMYVYYMLTHWQPLREPQS